MFVFHPLAKGFFMATFDKKKGGKGGKGGKGY
jgi:hypothetical protein